MKLLDKLRNIFFEEEEIEEVEEFPSTKKDKVIAKKINLPEEKTKTKEEVKEVLPTKQFIDERELIKEESNSKFSMMFEEEDFLDEEVQKSAVSPSKPEYKSTTNVVTYADHPIYENKPTARTNFKPSPIISPVYGILDKNYKKEEIVVKKEIKLSGKTIGRKLDIDAVRNKAYGDLTNDILENNVKININVKQEPEINIYDMSNDEAKPSIDKVTVGDAEEYFADLGLEYNIDYKDIAKEKATGRRMTKESIEEEEVKTTDENELEKSNEEKLEDNLFDLIESMYNKED